MNNENMAQFIQETRKARGMTQKQLAEKLNVTDKAVSKWERGIGCPDISLLSPLAEALQVSTGALLNGQENDRRSPEEPPTDKREEQLSLPEEERLVKNTLRYADRVRVHKWEALSGKIVLVLLLASLVAMAVCLICDVAVTGGVSWSLYPIASLVLFCSVTIPLLKLHKMRWTVSLLALTILIGPFLWLVLSLAGAPEYMGPLAVPVTIFSLVYCWTACLLLAHTRLNRWVAAGILVFLIPAIDTGTDLVVGTAAGGDGVTPWNLVSAFITTAAAIFLFWIGWRRRKKTEK